MPEYLAPGVYIEEVPSGSKPIEGVSTSTAGMVGVTQRGPTNTPALVTSFGAFNRLFGGFLDHRTFTGGLDALPYAAQGFFTNGGRRLYVTRIVGPNAARSAADIPAVPAGAAVEPVLTARAAAGATTLEVDDASEMATGDMLVVADGDRSEQVEVASVSGTTVTLAAGTEEAHAAGVSVMRQVPVLRAHALYEGLWGNDLRVTARPAHILETTVTAAASAGETVLTLDAVFGLAVGSVLEVETDSATERARIVGVDRAANTLAIASAFTGDVAADAAARSVEFDLIVSRVENGRVAESELFEGLSLDRESPRYAPRLVGSFNRATGVASGSGGSELIRLSDLTRNDADNADAPGAAAARLAQSDGAVDWPFADGDDDLTNIDDDSFIGVASDDPANRTGVQAMENEPAINIVAVPGRNAVAVQKALVNHCEKLRYRFAAIETPVGSNLREAQTWRRNFDTTRAAIYYPWLCIPDRFGERGDILKIPPTGHVLGIYARTDVERGVWKAPANEVVRGILSFETALTRGEQDILNPGHVNCFRDFRSANRALRLWGARTASSDPEWKYVNVRRLFLFIEESLDQGLQWAVFEPNAEPLWATVKQSISGFLTTLWRDGALEGTKEEEAFFVNVGFDVTMTQADIDNGRLIVEVGVAPVKPAEFVIIRISQKTREATS